MTVQSRFPPIDLCRMDLILTISSIRDIVSELLDLTAVILNSFFCYEYILIEADEAGDDTMQSYLNFAEKKGRKSGILAG